MGWLRSSRVWGNRAAPSASIRFYVRFVQLTAFALKTHRTSSSSTTVSTSTANATSTTPAGSPSVSQVLSPLLSPIIAPAPEPAPPVVTTEVAIARSQTPSDGPPNLSFVRGTLQDPEVRSIIDNLEVLQRQMRTLVDGHSSGFLVSDMAQRMLGAISDMEFAIRHQHAERLRRERGSSGTGHNVGTRDLGVPLGQELSYRYDLSGVYRHPGPGQTVGPFPGIPSVDIEAERRREFISQNMISMSHCKYYRSQ